MAQQPQNAPAKQQEERYNTAVSEFGHAILRLARGYEFDPDKRRDLEQEIHIALWRSLAVYDERCALRTWIYRVAHNTAVSYVLRHKRAPGAISLEEMELAGPQQTAADADRRIAMDRLTNLINQLKPLDRQTVLLYLEGMEASEIGEITGLSPAAVAVRIHRIKQILTHRFAQGGGR